MKIMNRSKCLLLKIFVRKDEMLEIKDVNIIFRSWEESKLILSGGKW